MRTVTQFAGMERFWAAVYREKAGGVLVLVETIRRLRKDAKAAYEEYGYLPTPGRVRIEHVYISHEVQVEVPTTVAEIKQARGW